MNSKVLILIGIALGVIITAGAIGGQQMLAQGDLTASEVMAIVQDNPEFLWDLIEDKVEVKTRILATSVNNDIDELTTSMTSLDERISSIENRFLIIEATAQVSTSAVVPMEDYQLTCLAVSGVELLSCEYKQSQIVYIRGLATDKDQYKWSIRMGNQIFVSQTSSIPSNGQFLFVFNTAADRLMGEYLVTVEIDGKTDKLKFTLN